MTLIKTSAIKHLVAAVERRNAAARKVADLENRLYEARRALDLAENRVSASHANAPAGTQIRFGGDAAWEVVGDLLPTLHKAL